MMPMSPRKVRLPSSGPEARASTEERPRGTEGPRGAQGATKSRQPGSSASQIRLACAGLPQARPAHAGSSCARLAPRQKQRQPDRQKVRLLSAGGIEASVAPVQEAGRSALSGGAAALFGERLQGQDTCRRALRVTSSGCWLALAGTPELQCSRSGSCDSRPVLTGPFVPRSSLALLPPRSARRPSCSLPLPRTLRSCKSELPLNWNSGLGTEGTDHAGRVSPSSPPPAGRRPAAGVSAAEGCRRGCTCCRSSPPLPRPPS